MATIDVLSAYEQEHLKSYELMDWEAIDRLLTKKYQLFHDRDRRLPRHERISILEKLAQLVEERRAELATIAAREGGKPLRDSLVEIDRGVSGIKVAIAELHQLGGKEIPMGLSEATIHRVAFTRREPIGVVLAISAFNHPFNLIVHQVVPAIAAGCPVLVKPASTTPMSCDVFVHLLYDAGLPGDWCTMVVADRDALARLVADNRLSFLTFIGSGAVGWKLRSQLAPGVHCALEHGGVAPLIVDDSVDVENIVGSVAKGAFYHAGQVCVSVQRIYVHERVKDLFTNALCREVAKLRVGQPVEESTDVGPLILPKECDRVATWVTEAVQQGGELLAGGQRLTETSYAPTVLLDPPPESKVACQEVFGPVACLFPYSELDQAISAANSLPYSFQAAVYTEQLDTAYACLDGLNAMGVMVNDHTAFRADWMPFGGHLQSGMGVGGIGYSMREMTVEKLMVLKSKRFS